MKKLLRVLTLGSPFPGLSHTFLVAVCSYRIWGADVAWPRLHSKRIHLATMLRTDCSRRRAIREGMMAVTQREREEGVAQTGVVGWAWLGGAPVLGQVVCQSGGTLKQGRSPWPERPSV